MWIKWEELRKINHIPPKDTEVGDWKLKTLNMMDGADMQHQEEEEEPIPNTSTITMDEEDPSPTMTIITPPPPPTNPSSTTPDTQTLTPLTTTNPPATNTGMADSPNHTPPIVTTIPINSTPMTARSSTPSGSIPPLPNNASSASSKTNQRGLNKPKCSVCGNVARSRCPYQACKSCCVKAKNPCQIHVLKQNGAATERSPAQTSAMFDQPRSGAATNSFSPSATPRSFSTTGLHQSHPYYSGTSAQAKAKRPLSRKEVLFINSWRFARLKDFTSSKIEAEDEAFERYISNVALLEDVLSSSQGLLAGLSCDGSATIQNDFVEHSNNNVLEGDELVDGLMLKLRSNTENSESHRQRLKIIIEKSLQKLQQGELVNLDEEDANPTASCMKNKRSTAKSPLERLNSISTLLDRVSKAQNQDDADACVAMYKHLTGNNLPSTQFINNTSNNSLQSICVQDEPAEMDIDASENGSMTEQKPQLFSAMYKRGWTEVKQSDENVQKMCKDLLTIENLEEL